MVEKIQTPGCNLGSKYSPPCCPLVRKKDYDIAVQYEDVHDLNISQSRRDDLESIGYVLMLFQSGSLPWYNSPNDWKTIGDIKKRTTVENLYRGCFKEFHYCRGRRFDEKPDYGSLKKLFRELFVRLGYEYDWRFDCTTV